MTKHLHPADGRTDPLRVFRLFAAFWALTAGLGLLPASEAASADDDTFEFHRGTRWTYEGDQNGTRRTVLQEVLRVTTEDLFWKDEPATVYRMAVRTFSEDTGRFELTSTTTYLALEEGYLVTGSHEGLPVRIYKLDSRKGDSWLCVDPRIRNLPELSFTHLGEEEVTVPAGTYKRARHIQMEIEADGFLHTGDMYIVPGVGIVKSQTTSEGNGQKKTVSLELKKFSSPREY